MYLLVLGAVALGRLWLMFLGIRPHMLTHADSACMFSYITGVKQYSSKKALVVHAKSHNHSLLQDGEQNCPVVAAPLCSPISKTGKTIRPNVHMVQTTRGLYKCLFQSSV